MITRVLKRKDYWRLGEVKCALFTSLSKDTKVIVSEQDGEIIGHWALIPYWHVECFEIYDGHKKKAGVAKSLLRTMFGILTSMRIKTVLTASLNDKMDKYLTRLGATELPGKHFVLPLDQGE